MTTEELLARESIRHTMAKYSIAGDMLEEAAYLSCFTEDAVLEFGHFPGQGELAFEGRKAIGEFVSGWFGAIKSGKIGFPGGSFMRHHLTTCRIDLVDSNTANATTYCMEFNDNGAEHSGYYVDVFRKVGDEWLIARRKWNSDK